uniref:Fibronectin type-III domain-containing protein n=1 Tax=Anas platyrhynchos platyrhynchos TaxID=8840 RepID=A0A493T007_ANAPP
MFSCWIWMFILLCGSSIAVPPDTPGNISCIYYFNVELTCNWTSGRETNLTTTYTLYRKIKNTQGLILLDSELSSCRSKTESCSFRHPNIPFSTSFCFQVKAQNVLGEAISECVPITMESIEKFEPPEILSVKKIAGIKQLLTVTWKIPEDILPAQYLNCQVRYRNLYSNSSEIDNVAVTSEEKVVSLNLTGLWDSTEYSVAVRCIGVESKFWSEWCREKTASTEDKAPSGKVDLWRIINSSHPAGNRPVHLMWKLLGNIPHPGRILGYKIQYFPENNAALQMTKITTNKKIVLPLKEEAYIISVTAYNSAGSSPAAVLRIPSTDEKRKISKYCDRFFSLQRNYLLDFCLSSVSGSKVVLRTFVLEPYRESYDV